MATPTNLYSYYSSIGKPLPSLSERAQLYQQFGLGSAASYGGSSAQNTSLLQKLITGGGSNQQSTQATQSYTPTAYTPPSPQQTAQDFSKIYQQLLPTFNKVGDEAAAKLEGASKGIEEAAQAKSTAILGLAPTVKDIYSNLATQLEKQYEREFAATERTNIRQSAEQTTQAAISGFETGSGFEAAMMRGIEREQQEILGAVTEKWGLKQEQLAAEQLKDLKTLEVEAADALLEGKRDVAAIIGQIATIRQQGAQLLTQASQAILTATDQRAAQSYQQYYNNELLKLKERELELSAAKLKLDQQQSSASTDTAGLMSLLFGTGPGASSAKDIKKYESILDKYLPKASTSTPAPNMSTNQGPVYGATYRPSTSVAMSLAPSATAGASASLRR